MTVPAWQDWLAGVHTSLEQPQLQLAAPHRCRSDSARVPPPAAAPQLLLGTQHPERRNLIPESHYRPRHSSHGFHAAGGPRSPGLGLPCPGALFRAPRACLRGRCRPRDRQLCAGRPLRPGDGVCGPGRRVARALRRCVPPLPRAAVPRRGRRRSHLAGLIPAGVWPRGAAP